MEYTIQQLAKLAGISTRTLRYYDEIGLLMPARMSSSGYRIYAETQVDTLQQIMFYKALGLELGEIKEALQSPSFNRLATLKEHLKKLEIKKEQIELMIRNVSKTIQKEEGKIIMTDQEKFEGLKREIIKDNDKKYGTEIREKYGQDVIAKSNAKMMNLTQEKYEGMQNMAKEINNLLEVAVQKGGSPQGEVGKTIAMMHKDWLGFTWPSYSPEAHIGLVQIYTEDERFKKYYDENVEGCAEFLKLAVEAWIEVGCEL